MKNQSIEIITTGEELLSGITQDSNFHWLAKQVFSMGFKVNYQQCIGDSVEDIVSALNLANKSLNPSGKSINIEGLDLLLEKVDKALKT